MGEVAAVFFPSPCGATEIHHIEQNSRDYKRKGLTKEESKSRDTQSSEEKKGETILQLKGGLERAALGVQTKRCTLKKPLCHPRGSSTNCPMKEGGEANETCERFLSLDPDLLCLC